MCPRRTRSAQSLLAPAGRRGAAATASPSDRDDMPRHALSSLLRGHPRPDRPPRGGDRGRIREAGARPHRRSAAGQQMRDVLSSFYGSLKGCDAQLEKLFITGIGRMVRTSIFSELNQMKDLTLPRQRRKSAATPRTELHRDFAPFIAAPGAGQRHDGGPGVGRRCGSATTATGGATARGSTTRGRSSTAWTTANLAVTGGPAARRACWSTLAETLQRPDGDLKGVKATDLSLLFDIAQPKAEPAALAIGLSDRQVRQRPGLYPGLSQRRGARGLVRHDARTFLRTERRRRARPPPPSCWRPCAPATARRSRRR